MLSMILYAGQSIGVVRDWVDSSNSSSGDLTRMGIVTKTKGKDLIKRFNSDAAHLLQHYHSSALRFSVGPSFALCSFHSWSGGLGGDLEV